MNEKERLENRCIKLILTKNIKLFSKLIKALKISKSKFYKNGLHKSEKILTAIAEISSQKAEPVETKKEVQKDGSMRSFSEIQAKLFIYNAFKKKKYDTLTDTNKKLLDRQILLLEWVLKIREDLQA